MYHRTVKINLCVRCFDTVGWALEMAKILLIDI